MLRNDMTFVYTNQYTVYYESQQWGIFAISWYYYSTTLSYGFWLPSFRPIIYDG